MGKSLTSDHNLPHIAVCPSAGMGHLLPFLRVASMLSSFNCRVTLMTIHPTVSTAETNHITSFLASHPHVHSLDAQLSFSETQIINHDIDISNTTTTLKTAIPDPFFPRYTAISNSAHLLACHLIKLTPPPTAILCDIMLVSGFLQALEHVGIPLYVFPITSCKTFAVTTFIAHNGIFRNNGEGEGEKDLVISPSISPIPKSSITPPFFNPNHILTKVLMSNSSLLHKCKGLVCYSFEYFEKETLCALREGNAALSNYFPPIFSIGPLKPLHNPNAKDSGGSYPSYLAWLDEQPSKSVMYVNFGSRTAMSKEQIRELGNGLEISGVRFLWVVKTTEVDNQDKEELRDLLGETFFEKNNDNKKGLVLKEWVDQDRVIVHPAVGGFLGHGGWNSITEAAQCGLPMLVWPMHGDQKMNSEVVAKAGLGTWESEWGWLGERLVKKEAIAEKIKEVMMNKDLRESARRVGEEASKAWEGEYGSSKVMMTKLIQDMISPKNV